MKGGMLWLFAGIKDGASVAAAAGIVGVDFLADVIAAGAAGDGFGLDALVTGCSSC